MMTEHRDAWGVIHFAAFKAVVKVCRGPWIIAQQCRRDDPLRVMAGLKWIAIFSSSCTVYGQPAVLPVTEDAPSRSPSRPMAIPSRSARRSCGMRYLPDRSTG